MDGAPEDNLWATFCMIVPSLLGLLAIGKASEFWDCRCFQSDAEPDRTKLHLYPKLRAFVQFVLIYIVSPLSAYFMLKSASKLNDQSMEAALGEEINVIAWNWKSLTFLFFQLLKFISVLAASPTFIGMWWYPTFGVQSTDGDKHYDDRTLIVFRWVTRGTSPNLIRTNLAKNWRIIKKYSNVKLEVVTDNEIGVDPVQCGIPSQCFDEIVVPKTFETPNSTLFKARALYYASMHSQLATRGSYIFHCDEESTVTDQLLIGVKEFVTANYGKIGQGLITYRNDEYTLSSYLCHSADSLRPADDIGRNRLQFAAIGKAVFGIKGSFVLVPS